MGKKEVAMTLYERVRLAGNASVEEEENELALLVRLREEMREHLSADTIAKLAHENPQRARNEVKSVCRRIFEQDSWKDVDAVIEHLLVEQLIDSIFGYGVLQDLILDEEITEVVVNGPFKVFIEKEGQLELTEKRFVDALELRGIIDRILGPLGRRIDESSSMVNARLPQGHRVNAVVQPIALEGPYLTIRKFSNYVITLEEMVESGSIDEGLQQFLIFAIKGRKNIAVSGGTGSGKTTFLNALSCIVPHGERIITIEDSAELRFKTHPNVVRLEARPQNAEGKGEITIRDLVKNALRMRPDRIIVGECRGEEALDMLQAMNTGHDGSLTTLHANSPEESIVRLATMVRYGSDLPIDVIEANIAHAIHLVIQAKRDDAGQRFICEVVTFMFDSEQKCCKVIKLYERKKFSDKGVWLKFPEWLEQYLSQNADMKEEVEQWKNTYCS